MFCSGGQTIVDETGNEILFIKRCFLKKTTPGSRLFIPFLARGYYQGLDQGYYLCKRHLSERFTDILYLLYVTELCFYSNFLGLT